MEEENLHTQNSVYVKSKARSDRGGGTWMHPILFVKFAMWLNPRFEVQVIKFVYDQMLKYGMMQVMRTKSLVHLLVKLSVRSLCQ